MDSRKGFLLPEQEKKVKELIGLTGIVGIAILPLLMLFDNVVLHRLKQKYLANKPEALPVIYEFVDNLFKEVENPE